MARTESFFSVLTMAIREFSEIGYASEAQLRVWVDRLRAAAERDLVAPAEMDRRLRASLGAAYDRLVERGGLLAYHPGVSRFTLERIKPELRDELGRRIMASANLARLDREETVTRTMRRFSGWATSLPLGGDEDVAKNVVKSAIRRDIVRTSFQWRTLQNDQSHKLAAALSAILARGSGAIAARWSHHFSLHPRPTHIDRDGVVYLIRNSWADDAGFVTPGKGGYYDDLVDQAGVAVNCRCSTVYYVALRQLPRDMLTQKGLEEMVRAAAA
jgi:hypothetical protein